MKLLLLVVGFLAMVGAGIVLAQSAEAEVLIIGNGADWGVETFNDTFTKSDSATTAMGALGNAEHVRLTLRSGAITMNHYISFDFSALPVGSVITDAKFQLKEEAGRSLSSGNVAIKGINSWTPDEVQEYTMTYDTRLTDVNTTAEDTVSVATNDAFYNWTVVNLVQKAWNAGNTSVAFRLETTATGTQDFHSKEGGDSTTRPRLYITYQPGAVAPTINNNHTYHGTTLNQDGTWIYDTLNANFDANITADQSSIDVAVLQIDGVNFTMTNTTANFWYANVSHRTIGTHQFRYCANDTNGKETCTGFDQLDMQALNIDSNSLITPVFETNTTPFNLTYSATPNATGQFAYFMWNATNNSFDYNPSAGTFGSTKLVPLLTGNNNTVISTYWNYTLVLSNGSTVMGGTVAQNQNVLYSYYFNDLTGSTQLISYESFSARGRAKNEFFSPGVGMNMSLKFLADTLANSTYDANQTWTGPSFLSSWNFTSPSISVSGDNSTVLYNASLSVTDGTNWRTTDLLGNLTVVVYNPSLDACGAASLAGTGSPVFGFFTYNETTNSNATLGTNADNDFYFRIFDPMNVSSYINSSFSVSNVNRTYVCMYPSNATLKADATITYEGITGHEPRNYYIYNATLATPPNNIKLFLLHNDAPAYLFPITLKDDSNNLLKGRLIQAQRYYPATNTYETVAMALTDDFGLSNAWLAPNNVYYKFAIYNGATLEDVISPLLLTCQVSTTCSLNLNIDTGGGVISSLGYLGNVFGACSWTNASLTLSCSWYDPQGLTNDFCLDVTQFGYLHPIPITSQCVSTATGTVGYTFAASNSSASYYWKLSSTLKSGTDNSTIVADGWIQNHGQPITGNSGLVLGFIVIGTISFLVMFSPIVGIVAMLFAMGIMAMLGIVDYGVGGVAGLAAVGGVIIWYIRRDR